MEQAHIDNLKQLLKQWKLPARSLSRALVEVLALPNNLDEDQAADDFIRAWLKKTALDAAVKALLRHSRFSAPAIEICRTPCPPPNSNAC